jgi:hypothetical protein
LQGFLKNIPIESLQLLCGFGVANSSPNGTVYFLDTLPDKLVDIRAEGFELDEFAEIQPWGRDKEGSSGPWRGFREWPWFGAPLKLGP